MTGREKSTLRLVAFWGRNMMPIRSRGWVWPGFDYSDAEWARLEALGRVVSSSAYLMFQGITAVLVIALLGVLAFALVSLASALLPASAGPYPLVVLGVLMTFLTLGVLVPLAMRIAAAASIDRAAEEKLSGAPGDAALAAKIARQFRRVAVFAAGVIVLIFVTTMMVPESMQAWAGVAVAVVSAVAAIVFL